MSKARGEKVADEQIRQYIKNLAAKKGEGSDVSVEHLRKKFGIGYKRAKRLHDDELGPTNHPKITLSQKRDPSDAVTDETVVAFLHKCREEGRDISTNELRQELHIGYKRAVRLLTQGEKGVRSTSTSGSARKSRKRSSLTQLQDDGDVDADHAVVESVVGGAIDELATLHHLTSPNKRAKRGRKSLDNGSIDGSDEGEVDKEDVTGLDEATKVLEAAETLDEGRVVDTNGDGLLSEFTEAVLGLPKGSTAWDLQSFEYMGKDH